MLINTSQKENEITFLDTTCNRTMIAVSHYDREGKEVDCAVGDLKLVNMSEVTKHEKHKINKTKFVLYDHFRERYFTSDPECC